MDQSKGEYAPRPLGRSLTEELAICMLSGFGIRAEAGAAAFRRLRDAGLIERPDRLRIEVTLRELRYRFPASKAKHLALALVGVRELTGIDRPLELRDALVKLPGVGPKTASWIVRNRFGCDDIAILDVHIVRWCERWGVFDRTRKMTYFEAESRFLRFAACLEVRPSILDNLMWRQLRIVGDALDDVRTAS
ncbi:MAG TPA: hypothetical protein VFO25_08080 [Candidatus Eremiobacteraceae bacterium]|nr:hypothetical protein [Candidatus Eremiobacteraceae bacterium]